MEKREMRSAQNAKSFQKMCGTNENRFAPQQREEI